MVTSGREWKGIVVTADQLFADYNFWRLHTWNVQRMEKEGIPIRTLTDKNGEKRLALNQLRYWCGRRDLDTRFFLATLFGRTRWQFAPQFGQLIPKSAAATAKAIHRYHNPDSATMTLFRLRVSQEVRRDQELSGAAYDGSRDLSATTEALKRRYLEEGDAERCLEEMDTNTLGYHPRSLVCAGCALASRCEALLRHKSPAFDIIALRRGELTLEQAKGLVAQYASR